MPSAGSSRHCPRPRDSGGSSRPDRRSRPRVVGAPPRRGRRVAHRRRRCAVSAGCAASRGHGGRSEGATMARFLIIGRYAAEGARGLMAAGGSARKSAVEKAVTGLGGRIETFDFAFGEDDIYTIVDMPNAESITALA